MIKETKNDFLFSVFDNILSIAKGECTLTDEFIYSHENELEQRVLEGLLFLHQDIELYKIELRKAMETEYKLKMLKEKNNQLQQFSFAASHDLKEPVRTICSFSSLILKSNNENLDDRGKEYLNFVIDASQRMWDLINGLSKYTEVGKEQTTTDTDIKKLIDHICLDLNAQIKEKQVNFVIDPLPTIRGLKLELRQLFQNLISNAIKYRNPDRALQINITFSESKSDWIFSVMDNGLGISPENRYKIFNMYDQIDENKDGVGIGLNTCKQIVDSYGGEIWVESELGKGSAFKFSLPKERPDFL